MWSYFQIELTKFFKNRKNIAVYVILLSFAFFYSIRIAPAYDPIEKVDIQQMEANYLNREEFIINREGKDNLHAHPSILYALAIFPKWNQLELDRMKALQEKDLKKYAEVTSEWYLYTDEQTYRGGYYYYNPRYYTYGNRDAHLEGHLAYLSTAARYDGYSKMDGDITLEVLEEFTALQTIYRMMQDYLPYVFLIGALLLSVDIVVQDRKNPTLLRGFPITDWKKMLVKWTVAMCGSFAMIIPLLVLYIIVGLQFGFGSLDLPVPVNHVTKYEVMYETITMKEYFLKVGLLLAIWFAIITSFAIFLNLVFRSEMVSLLAGVVLIFSEFFYMDRGYSFFKPVHQYLPTYTQVSNIVTNEKNFFYETSEITLSHGLILLVVTVLILLILNISITLVKRYKMI